MNHSNCGIVIPTLGKRPDYLRECLSSIRASGNAFICVVGRNPACVVGLETEGLVDQFVLEQTRGLPNAINLGMRSLPPEIEFVNWLGDDDLLAEGALDAVRNELLARPKAGMVFGSCTYINGQGTHIWHNHSGQWAVPLLRFGPCLVPQPGALFRRSSFNKVGCLSENLGWAFDLDLFIKLSKVEKLVFIPRTVSSFRWYPESLSVGRRAESVCEASMVRKLHLPRILRPIAFIWEFPVRLLTMIAGLRVSKMVSR